MTRKGKLLLIGFLVIAGPLAAWATNDTIGVTAGSGKIANLLKFGSGNVISETGVCDGNTENLCATVDANGLWVNVKAVPALPIGSTTSGSNGSLVFGATTTANPANTNAQNNPLSSDVRGNTRVVLGGGVPETASTIGTTAATTATLATSASTTTYICGFSIRANATAAATGNATVTGTITGTMNFTQWTAPNASGLGVTEELFTPCIPASAANTSIAVVSAAPGTGGVVSVSAWGYQQ